MIQIQSPEVLTDLFQTLIKGESITRETAEALANINDPALLEVFFTLSNALRAHFLGDAIEFCSIINAKSGQCSEDCKFCAQSAHYETSAETYDLMTLEPIMNMALENEAAGVHRFSLVTSGYGVTEEEFDLCCHHYQTLSQTVDMHLCASLGVLTEHQLMQLATTGVSMYHHNLETSRRYYQEICTTHSYDVRIETIRAAQSAGLKVCSGGIIGMGETMSDRLDLIYELKELGIQSIPVNVLNPIPGTPLFNMTYNPISVEDVYKTIALFRWIHPTADIRLAGGRSLLPNSGKHCFEIGASATITGNYLTTSGQNIEEDHSMINALGLEVSLGQRE